MVKISPTATVALKCADAHKRYGDRTVLADASFTCPVGAVTALIGPNGAGKSTFFRASVGLINLDSGRITVGGHEAGTPQAQRSTSLMPEQPDLYPGVSVWEHIVFVALLYRLECWRPAAEELLERFGLADRRDTLSHELSQGMRRRLALVMALLRGAGMLLLDEPFNGLDPRNSAELRTLVRELAADGAGVLVATHILSDVVRLADRVVVLERGRVIAQGTLDELCREAGLPAGADLESSYLALTDSLGDSAAGAVSGVGETS
ncbi:MULTISPECIES: ABC transporter ATP-binding protein [unclassified Crossiella]|uniref:ABC transporter ATP-binding protein n=1 Tax=unclassified Crossiella TaxID=2620835 RepID=UPI001FFF8887|nr:MULTISPECIES: ABC transporter ATP-binding protein [unclassified Crossiella]MCK2242102.1 ABC transporter ATP-binding protein [Crossiella sp. S99.2]MCK2256005.1 ABC transporter ATP-binding protein [Crossiella sp. S99.1]